MFTRIVWSHSYHVSLTVALRFTCLVMLLLQPKDWFRDWPQTIGRQGGAAHPGLHDAHQHLHTGDWELDFTSPYLPLAACCITGSGSNSATRLHGEYLHLPLFLWWRKYSQVPAGGRGLPAIRNVLKWSGCENKILQICNFHPLSTFILKENVCEHLKRKPPFMNTSCFFLASSQLIVSQLLHSWGQEGFLQHTDRYVWSHNTDWFDQSC